MSQISASKAKVPRTYRHNPYAYVLLNVEDQLASERSFASLYQAVNNSNEASRTPTPPPDNRAMVLDTRRGEKKSSLGAYEGSPECDDGMSEVSSSEFGVDSRSSPNSKEILVSADSGVMATQEVSGAPAAAAATVFRYASVNFRFGSAWFVAPFRTFVGDMVVVEYPENRTLHMGIVSAITTKKPLTFYTETNMDVNYLSPEEVDALPRLLRHARSYDKEVKLELRNHDLRSLRNAQALAADIGAPANFLDAEWLLDLGAVTFLIEVVEGGDVSLLDNLADELAIQEGAEVVFTFPVRPALYQQ